MPAKTLLLLKPKNLLTHPRNMRRFYPAEDVRELANSILAGGGVLHPLIVVEPASKNDHKYTVVDGNMRLKAGQLLEDKCPPLECKVVDQAEADQLLSMAISNGARYDVDAVSEGLHYKALRDEGMTVREISKRTGIYEARIHNRLPLAELPPRVQELIVAGKLPADTHAAKALLLLTRERATKLAERLAENPNIKVKTVIAAAEKMAHRQAGGKPLKRPAAELSGALRTEKKAARVAEIRAAAQKACQACNQYEGKLRATAEPAWAMVVHAADATCGSCPLKDMATVCASCPAVQLLKKLVAHD